MFCFHLLFSEGFFYNVKNSVLILRGKSLFLSQWLPPPQKISTKLSKPSIFGVQMKVKGIFKHISHITAYFDVKNNAILAMFAKADLPENWWKLPLLRS